MVEDPRLDLDLGDQGAPVVLLGEADEATDMAGLPRLADRLAAPARAANHFAHAAEDRVILDPAGFAAAYRARLAREDPGQEWREGVMRLSDFGVPDFATIAPPPFEAGRLSFCAEDSFTGLPYRAETAELTAAPSYAPLPLPPLRRPPLRRPARPPGGEAATPPSPEEEAAFRAVRAANSPRRPPDA